MDDLRTFPVRSGKLNSKNEDSVNVSWLEAQPESSQEFFIWQRLDELFKDSSQPRHLSGNACTILCHFIEQCRSSSSLIIQKVALSEVTCLKLFSFYIESNEKNQNRSIRQVLDLLASLILHHPDRAVSNSIKALISQKVMLIITHHAAQPLVKPALKVVEYLLSKRALSLEDVTKAYHNCITENSDSTTLDSEFSKSMLPVLDSLISELFAWLALPDISPAAGRLLVTLFRRLKTLPNQDSFSHAVLWQKWIADGLKREPEILENVKNYIFSALFKLERPGSLEFLELLIQQKPMSHFESQVVDTKSLVQLAAIEVGKKSGLVEDPDTVVYQKPLKKTSGLVELHEDVLGILLANRSGTVRSLAFSVLVSSSSSIRPFSQIALGLLQKYLHILHADTDAKFRNDVLSNTKHMVERLRGGTSFLSREIKSFQNEGAKLENQDNTLNNERSNKLIYKLDLQLQQHRRFIDWYTNFLLQELLPTSSYQRHITALRAILVFLQSGIIDLPSRALPTKFAGTPTTWPFTIMFFVPGTMRLLMDLLMNPFEDVRNNAMCILKLASAKQFMTETGKRTEMSRDQSLDILTSFINRAKEMAERTGRADYADGLGRTHELLYCLMNSVANRTHLIESLVRDIELKVLLAERDLSRAILESPLHGALSSLNFVWDSVDWLADFTTDNSDDDILQKSFVLLQRRVLSSCVSIWKIVKDVLCNDSPEGHIPLNLDETDSIDTKDILSFSFRAINESSNLLMVMINKLPMTWKSGKSVIPIDIFISIGDLSFDQLSQLRHRGAFSTVSLTFTRCCQLCQTLLKSMVLKENPIEKWYRRALVCIQEQASTTRRSAGIPALMTGILSANSTEPSFENVMEEMMTIARQNAPINEKDNANLPQVHAMNSLREIFKSSTLGRRSESYIPVCFQLAADSLTSDTWAIRNCSLLLLRSLTDCLFGTSESKIATEAGWDGRSIKLSYEKYPDLPEILLRLLKTELYFASSNYPTTGAVESVFPALDIIRRAGPPNHLRDEIYACVSMHLGSRVWLVRELSARTICTLLLHNDWLPDACSLLENCLESPNLAHGVLVAVRFVLERRSSLGLIPSSAETQRLIFCLHQIKRIRSLFPSIFAAYLDVLNEILRTIAARCEHSLTRPDPTKENDFQALVALLPSGSTHLQFKTHISYAQRFLAKPIDLTSLLLNASARLAVSLSSLQRDSESLTVVLNTAASIDSDVALATLEAFPSLLSDFTSTERIIESLSGYVSLILHSNDRAIHSAVLNCLSRHFDALNLLSEIYPQQSYEPNNVIRAVRHVLRNGREGPELSNAEIAASGCLLLAELCLGRTRSITDKRLHAFSELMATASNGDNVFDTRFAAVTSLNSFFASPFFLNYDFDEKYIPALFILYDTLHDDDEEIRNKSATTVSSLLCVSLVPLAAQEKLSFFLARTLDYSPLFLWNVVYRMTQSEPILALNDSFSLIPAEIQLAAAIDESDELFVQEEQNLFQDEIRECKRWAHIFYLITSRSSHAISHQTSEGNRWQSCMAELAGWVLKGLFVVNDLVSQVDGPLGWTAKPAVFSICTRICLCAKLMTHETTWTRFPEIDLTALEFSSIDVYLDIIKAQMELFVTVGTIQDIHQQLLHVLNDEEWIEIPFDQ